MLKYLLVGFTSLLILIALVDFDMWNSEPAMFDPSVATPALKNDVTKPASNEEYFYTSSVDHDAGENLVLAMLRNMQLVGVSYNSDPMLRISLLEFNDEQRQYKLNDFVFDTSAKLIAIEFGSVTIAFNNKEYFFSLNKGTSAPSINDLSAENIIDGKSTSMDATAIGNRPKKLSHIIHVPTNYEPGDKLYADFGLNPRLFKNAGFKKGDELLKVNDLDISLADFFDEIENTIRTEHTLKFEVLREGKKRILFLDIPSETLNIQ